MTIDDNSPERINLLICSFCFIVFFVADGELTNNTITLQIINIKFNNLTVLISIAWIMIFWFALRYWQKTQGKFDDEFKVEINTRKSSWIVVKYAEYRLNNKHRIKDGFHIKEITKYNGTYKIIYGEISSTTGEIDRSGKLTNFATKNNLELTIDGKLGRLLLLTLLFQMFFLKPSVGSYLIPYLLFIYSVFLGLTHLTF